MGFSELLALFSEKVPILAIFVLLAAVLLQAIRQIIKRGLLPGVTRQVSGKLLEIIIKRTFNLLMVALILMVAVYAYSIRMNGSDHDNEKVPVRVKIFPQRFGEISGVDMRVVVDGNDVGKIANVPKPISLSVPPLEKGAHAFRFEDISAYLIEEPNKFIKQDEWSGLECEGDFVVSEEKTYQVSVRIDEAGQIHCSLK